MKLVELLLVGFFFGSAQGVKIFLSYSDATCVDDNTIQGTVTISYDDASYSFLEYSDFYSGECLYYVGGYADSDNYDWDSDVSDILDYGACVTCNGQVGCSSDGTCSNFMTYPGVTQSNAYQMTSNGGESSSQRVKAPAYGMAIQNIEIATLAAQEQSASALAAKNAESSFSLDMMIVGVVGAAGLLMFLLALIRFSKKKRAPKIDRSAILDGDQVPTATQYQISSPTIV